MLIDAAKRKALPAWIREGLEKMEKEKAKKEEQEKLVEQRKEQKRLKDEELKKAEEEAARTGIPMKSKFVSQCSAGNVLLRKCKSLNHDY